MECYDFHGFGSGREGSGWVQNHTKCMELASFSCLGKWKGGEQVASKIHKKHIKTVGIFMVLEVGGKGTSGLRFMRNV